ncbi:MAG: phytanoyl-CoA dioxygenase family protein [Arenicella sp.]
MLSKQQQNQFIRDGYLVLPNLLDEQELASLRAKTHEHLQENIQPFERETDVHYPGAPESEDAPGGGTIRRLLQAYSRHQLYRSRAENSTVVDIIKSLLQAESLYLTPNHHNCVMTKQPEFSSQTNWHRDTRYWHFSNKYLINAWYALGDERVENGGMLLLPGSHRWDVNAGALDEDQFLLEDHPSNQARLSLSEQVDLQAGDCLLFSAHCFHAAGANNTDQAKFSLVYTYHSEKTLSLPSTKSSILPSIKIG